MCPLHIYGCHIFPHSLQIIVQWEAVPGTATADDYSPTRGVVTLANGTRTAPIPITITDETIPEFSEQFTIRLVGVVGGARLGGVSSAMVTISASDNPNGALRKFWNGIETELEWECDRFFSRHVTCRVHS